MNEEMMNMIAARVGKTTKVPAYTTKRRKTGEELPAYHIKVKNKRTGQVHTMTREKAFRYINGRPNMWSITNPVVSFKDDYELAR